ncbi:MAG: DUF6456 domain-containing protein [Pseudomonadota bacterium]
MAKQQATDLLKQMRACQDALFVIEKGRCVSAASFAELKRGGYVSGTRALPSVTARGLALLSAELKTLPANTSAQPGKNEAHAAYRIPDIVTRLARPRKGEACLLERSDVLAAERLQHDLHKAQIMPRIGQNWSLSALTSVDGGSHKGASDLEIGNMDARQRVQDALAAVGPEFSGLLLDICLFEKSLKTIEAERRWPARSGKLAVALGLKSLARHYDTRCHANRSA